MMHRLQAEEQLAAIEAVALGSGTVKKNDRRAAISRLQRQARAGGRAAKATPAMLQMIGIKVIEVPAAKTSEAVHG